MIRPIPVFVEKDKGAHLLRPLFAEEPLLRHRELGRGLSELVRALRSRCQLLGRERRHDELAQLLYCPEVTERRLTLQLLLKKSTFTLDLLLVQLHHLGRRLAFSPQVPDLWFSIGRGEEVTDRAAEVFLEHFRELERDEEALDDYSLAGRKAWLTTVEIDLSPPRRPSWRAQGGAPFAIFGGGRQQSGAEQLAEVGRCLDELYPDELGHAYERERQVAELIDAITAKPPRPVVLLGPPKAGKTALVQELVRRTIEARGGPSAQRRRLWLISPQRLIAGMSYVGQWEQRLLAILKELRLRRHIWFCDDLVGLFRAGRSAESSLTVGDVLKPSLERRELAFIGEATPSAFNLLKEVDRGFADLLQVIPIREMSADETLLVLLRLIRELEGRWGCRFHPGVLPKVIELQRRHGRQLAFPGKAALMLERLAMRHAVKSIDASTVLDDFHKSSGLSRSFLDDGVRVTRDEIKEALGRRLLGQPAAIEALADVVSIGKAGLQDPTRPLASCLFLGPTGVGKTEAAKALAAYLLEDEGALIRFDMNEYGDPTAAARLVGSFDQPAGQLTAALGERPFAVLLLDEIEKAHPAVFDLLLQVLDDGRLTDAGGRTADFTGAFIILTSNLGAEEARSAIGFDDRAGTDPQIYLRAAERFFRPELFNRLDRIVPFARLDRETIAMIAQQVLSAILAREGLARRAALLDLDPEALETLVELGFHPELGARALKRAAERRLVRPVAARLAALHPGRPTVVSVSPRGRDDFEIHLTALEEAEMVDLEPAEVDLEDPAGLRAKMEQLVARLDEGTLAFRPREGLSPEEYRPEHELYFDLRDRLALISSQLEELREREEGLPPEALGAVRVRNAKPAWVNRWERRTLRAERAVVTDLRQALLDLLQRSRPAGEAAKLDLIRLVRRLSILDAVIAAGPEAVSEGVLVASALLAPEATMSSEVRYELGASTAGTPQLEDHDDRSLIPQASSISGQAAFTQSRPWLLARAPLVARQLAPEVGAHLFWRRDGGFTLLVVGLVPLVDDDHEETYQRWRRETLASLRGGGGEAPQIVRYHDQGKVLDVRTGLALEAGQRDELLQTHWPVPEALHKARGS